MDRSSEATMWRRGFAAGCLALALSVGGQAASGRGGRDVPSCPVRAQLGVAEQVVQHLRPVVRSHGGIAQRVVLAVLAAVLHSDCS